MTIRLPMADCHNDLLIGCLHQRERGHTDPFGDFWLPQLRAGGVVLQVLPTFIEEQWVGEGALRRTLLMLEEAWRIADMHPADVAICLTGADIEKAIASGRIALILALEGSEGIGRDMEVMRSLHRIGVRMISMAWNRRTMMADGVGEKDTGGRLTTVGIEAVAEMERLGIVLDISHLSEAGFWHVTEIATRPFVASHSSCRALQGHPRNLTDDQLRAIAAAGGFVALNAFGPFLSDDPGPRDLIRHAVHAAGILGAGSVALGMDYMLDLAHTVDPILGRALVRIDEIPYPQGLRRPDELQGIADLLIEALGEQDAALIASGTMREHLSRLLPAG